MCERLDFEPENGSVSFYPSTSNLPSSATRVAAREGIHALLVEFPAGTRLTGKLLRDALRECKRTLSQVFLVATNAEGTEWQFVYPQDKGGREVVRRLAFQAGQPRRTVVQQLAGIYRDAPSMGLARALERAYDVEAVTKRFFAEYRRVFERVMALVTGLPDDEDRRIFCQTLFNRLMFLYFLQRKSWLTFEGNADYLNALWKDHERGDEGQSFYIARLRLLFFTALSNDRSADYSVARDSSMPLIGRVPFLNGGLFAEGPLDQRPGVDVPDEAIRLILKELFDRFNFTITESTPYDVEVAVDPEMLGKVFEELVTGRHETGSYYTPRPVVAFMCREALKGYLTTNVPGLSAEAGAAFVDEHQVGGLTITQANAVLEKLETITVADPACGSGAYLLGMLHELVELQRLLYNSSLIAGAKELYDLKLRVIQNNVYGVDIDAFAVNIAMLRLWLSLVVEYEGNNPPPLPNLDYKIEVGDSLAAPNPQITTDLIQHTAVAMAKTIADLKSEYMRATGDDKRQRHDEIEQRQAELRAMLSHSTVPDGAMDWRVEFAEVFSHGGFDVVLANPPYLRMELFKDKKPLLRRNFAEVHAERADLYVYFFQRANELLRPGGLASFISSNKWLRAGYGAALRGYLESHSYMQLVLDFGELPVFETATTYPAVFIWQKAERGDRTTRFADVPDLDALYAEGITRFVARAGDDLPAMQFKDQNWSLVSTRDDAIRRKMESAGVLLEAYVPNGILRGIVTGYNDAFWINEAIKDRLIGSDPKSSEVIKPLLVGDDIRRYEAYDRGRYLLYLPHGVNINRYPAVLEYLRPYRAKLEARATEQPWYELQQPQAAYAKHFESPKIVYPVIANSCRFWIDEHGFYVNDKIFVLPAMDYSLLGVLNTHLTWWYLQGVGSMLQGESMEFRAQYMKHLPVVAASSQIATLARECQTICTMRRTCVQLYVRSLLEHGFQIGTPSSKNPLEQPWKIHDEAAYLRRIRARGDAAQEWALEQLHRVSAQTAALTANVLQIERQIDRLVYGLYGLTVEEVAVVEGTRAVGEDENDDGGEEAIG